ncbi:MAG: OmpH family outer membrane protein [Myxococcales bacterium]|nr:OmpH family outer membrane protein [Myxococcales bacterium]
MTRASTGRYPASTMKTTWALLVAMATVATDHSALAAPGSAQVAYVDLQKAILSVDEGQRAKAALRKTYEKKQTELSAKEQELKTLKDTVEREMQTKVDTPEARERRAQFQQKLMALQQNFMKEQQELQQLEAKELSAITE